MASPHHDNVSMALFCDFENVALGVRDAKYEKFDIKRVLERLLLKGSIVVKKAYCDWERYKGFKATMHEASFELIEIPHVRQSGKNSADIRLVVDALDLCYTKSHVNTFVIISGDSDFSPLVSKLRENAKQVIGVGVKQSTSDLLIANCDEFIFYDDLVRESERAAAKPERDSQPAKRSPDEEQRRRDDQERRKTQAVELAVETFDALVAERGDSGKIWASLLKEAIKRRKPGFNESYYGFRAFGNLLEEAQTRGLLELGRDEKSGTYVHRATPAEPELTVDAAPETREAAAGQPAEASAPRHETRRRGRGRREREPVAAPAFERELAAQPGPSPSEAPSEAIEAAARSEPAREHAPAAQQTEAAEAQRAEEAVSAAAASGTAEHPMVEVASPPASGGRREARRPAGEAAPLGTPELPAAGVPTEAAGSGVPEPAPASPVPVDAKDGGQGAQRRPRRRTPKEPARETASAEQPPLTPPEPPARTAPAADESPASAADAAAKPARKPAPRGAARPARERAATPAAPGAPAAADVAPLPAVPPTGALTATTASAEAETRQPAPRRRTRKPAPATGES